MIFCISRLPKVPVLDRFLVILLEQVVCQKYTSETPKTSKSDVEEALGKRQYVRTWEGEFVGPSSS